MSLMTEQFLWASLIWGSVASGYCIYGWKQRSAIPFVAGMVMMLVSFALPALPMTLASVVIIALVWWLLRRGY